MPNRLIFRYWLLALVLCVICVIAAIAWVDRPMAEFFDAHLSRTEFWVWLDRALRPIAALVLLALLFLMACGLWVLSGRRLRPSMAVPLLCSLSAMWALAADIIFKSIFGRGWPYPTYLQDHLYGFHLLHGGPHWESFPSGTAAISSAIVAVAWVLAPRWRTLGVLVVVLLSGAVVVANFHWLSDVIAGAFLGVSIGLLTVRLLHPLSFTVSKE